MKIKSIKPVLVAVLLLAGIAAAVIVLRPSRESQTENRGDHATSETRSKVVQVERDRDSVEPSSPAQIEREGAGTASGLEAERRIIGGFNLDPENPSHVRFATIFSTSDSYSERAAAVRSLPRPVSEADRGLLYRFLLAPPEERSVRSRERAIKNEILNLLREDPTDPEALTATMIAMFEDANQDEAVRDYALQHLRSWYPYAPDHLRDRITTTLLEGFLEADTSMPGTSLISLHSLEKQEGVAVPEIDVTAEALRLVHSRDADVRSQITAMQVAADRSAGEVMSTAAEWALDPEAGYPRRLSAIAALGRSGSAEAVSILREIEAENDRYLQPAIATAYRRLNDSGSLNE